MRADGEESGARTACCPALPCDATADSHHPEAYGMHAAGRSQRRADSTLRMIRWRKLATRSARLRHCGCRLD